MHRTPNVFIVGAPKAGSTALYHQLGEHPDIFMSPRKEPNFFSGAAVDDPDALRRYETLFDGASTEAVVGEASVKYLHHPKAPARLKRYAPAAKILVLLRHPVERAYSHYRMTRYSGEALHFRSFRQASKAMARALERGDSAPFGSGYRQSFYADALERYLKTFGSNVLVVLHEHMLQDPGATYRRTLEFLGVDTTFVPDSLSARLNVGRGNTRSGLLQKMIFSRGVLKQAVKTLLPDGVRSVARRTLVRLNARERRPLGDQEIRELTRFFKADVERTSRLIGVDLSAWMKGEHVVLP